jgi:HlyD family secretion protein
MVSAAQVEATHEQNRLRYEADVQLNQEGLMPSLDLNISRLRTEQSERQWMLEQERLASASEAYAAQLVAAEVRLEQTRGSAVLRRDQYDRLRVRAGTSGILEQVPIEVGQQIGSGTNVARVSRPEELMAELDVAETQARDIQLGQYVSIDTRNGIIPGHVTRVDPTVINGTVLIDVSLDGELPPGARPDLSVDGIIEIERLDDVLYVDRPTYAQANSTISVFKIMPGGEAVRTSVGLGIISVSEVEILEGLQVGDQIILSDMSAWEEFDRVQLD